MTMTKIETLMTKIEMKMTSIEPGLWENTRKCTKIEMEMKKMKQLDRTVDRLLKIAELYRQVCTQDDVMS